MVDDKMLGKVVDFNNPNMEILKKIFDSFDVEYPKITHDTLNNQETFETNFNGGLYGIPTKHLNFFVAKQKEYAMEMLNSKNITELLKEKVNHIDQISFALTLQSLEINYNLLTYEYNCPTHVVNNFDVLKQRLTFDVKVLHFHSNLSTIGLLNLVNIAAIDKQINKINTMLKKKFDNKLFWNYRYSTNPQLGSGVGSRGETAKYKLHLLKLLGLENTATILDVGCGDLEIVSKLNLKSYTGIDVSDEALKIARNKFPQHNFFHALSQVNEIQKADTVVCLDVLIHQSSKKEYDKLIDFISIKAENTLIVSGYENSVDSSHMCYFYENLRESLEKTKQFKYIFKIGEYRGLSVYMADKGNLSATNNKNDMKNKTIDDFLSIDNNVNYDLLLENIVVSRNIFKWYTKHFPRLYEYPWLLEKVDNNLQEINIAELGSGVTPLPLLLSKRGANVHTIDSHAIKRELNTMGNANEWGFFDYSVVDKKMKSYNTLLDEKLFQNNVFDVWYSISVVEHMPAQVRRNIFKIMRDTLKADGKLFLTIDLMKDSENLWNMSEGKEVEDTEIHGTLNSFVMELEGLDFTIDEKQIIRMPKNERVDIALINGVLKK
ncbi:methyltransferase [Candidatus Acidulodesulfobacterium sp. H_13]|uniref:methyltransferase n=1 Tax=Candidatus Acidulodesulfobacterium sp. H_13 TaxID=3395470 RepID=UPI003AF68A46